jgi:hypothetical protein
MDPSLKLSANLPPALSKGPVRCAVWARTRMMQQQASKVARLVMKEQETRIAKQKVKSVMDLLLKQLVVESEEDASDAAAADVPSSKKRTLSDIGRGLTEQRNQRRFGHEQTAPIPEALHGGALVPGYRASDQGYIIAPDETRSRTFTKSPWMLLPTNDGGERRCSCALLIAAAFNPAVDFSNKIINARNKSKNVIDLNNLAWIEDDGGDEPMVQQIVAQGESEVLQLLPNFRAAAESIVAAGGNLTVQEVQQSIVAVCNDRKQTAHGYRWCTLKAA